MELSYDHNYESNQSKHTLFKPSLSFSQEYIINPINGQN